MQLRSIQRSRPSRFAGSRRRPYRSRFPIEIEPLEERIVPAHHWTGLGSDTNWSTAANWREGTAPSAGEDLVFPVSASDFTAHNDFPANTEFNSITFDGDQMTPVSYHLDGNSIRLDAGIAATAPVYPFGSGVRFRLTFNLNTITLTRDQTFGVVYAGFALNIASVVDLNQSVLTLWNGNTDTVGGTDELSGVVENLAGAATGAGGIVKTGPGRWDLLGANTYRGLTTLAEGELGADSATALGSPADGTVVQAGASLGLGLIFGGTTGSLISEPLTIAGDGVSNPPSVGQGSGPWHPGAIIVSASGFTLAGRITLSGDSSIQNDPRLPNPHSCQIGNNPTSTIIDTQNHILTLAGALDVDIDGAVVGDGAIKQDADVLSETGSIYGGLAVSHGTLFVGQTDPSGTSAQPGILTVSGRVDLAPVNQSGDPQGGTTYRVELTGNAAHPAYSQLNGLGPATVNLNNAQLDIGTDSSFFAPTPETSYAIVDKRGLLSGRFTDANGNILDDGALVPVQTATGTQMFQIHYQDSGQVLLTALPVLTMTHVLAPANALPHNPIRLQAEVTGIYTPLSPSAAAVSVRRPGAASGTPGIVPTGTVTFHVNGRPVGNSAVDATTGLATLMLDNGLDVGDAQVTAAFSPAPGNPTIYTASSSDPASIHVAPVTAPVTHLALTFDPSTIYAGDSVTFTVLAEDASNQPVPGYTGTASFVLTDPQTSPPPAYTFTAADNGEHRFTVSFETAGTQYIAATDAQGHGTDPPQAGPVIVLPGAAKSLALYIHAAAGNKGDSVAVSVTAVDQFGNRDSSYTGTLVFAANPQAELPANTQLRDGYGEYEVRFNTPGFDQPAVGQTLVVADALGNVPGSTVALPIYGPSDAIVPAPGSRDADRGSQRRLLDTVHCYARSRSLST